MRIVVALGGNAILARGASGSAQEQRDTVRAASEQLADLITAGHEVIVTHGNGPQVGRMMVQQRAAALEVPAMPLDVLDAQTQGQIGYLLAQQLGNALRGRGVERTVVAVVTQVVVDPGDPAFARPDKPVGPHYTETELEFRAQRGTRAHEPSDPRSAEREVDGEAYRKVEGGTWRRVVPSPLPVDVVEVEAVEQLLAAGVVPVCAGGGGCPVARDGDALSGVEAVVDKDRTAALLTRLVAADGLLILTDVEAVLLGYGTPAQRPLEALTAAQARRLLDDGEFPAGSMGPKMEAAVEAAEAGTFAVITSLARAGDALRGKAGTRVTAAGGE